MQSQSLAEAIAGLAALKQEHRPLVEQIAGDAGMSPETRRMLLTHLNEEEEERVAEIQALLGGGGGAPAPGADRPAVLTVGSLRVETPPAPRPVGGDRLGALRFD